MMKKISSMPDEQPDQVPRYNTLCAECQTGVMHLEHITYFTWLNQELVTVPNFPAWICDVCGRREYDSRAIVWLNTLLNPETGRNKSVPRRRPGQPSVDHPQP